MNKNFIRIFLSNLLITSFVFSLIFDFLIVNISLAEAAEVPSIISYQGRLADSSGNLLGGSGTTYYFKFSIWNNASVGLGSRLWPVIAPSSYSTNVRQGVFTVNLGDTASGFPHALDYDFASAGDVYLQVEASSDNSTFQTLSPRQRISASPFARLSSAVSGSTTPSSFGTTTPFGTSIVSIEATSSNSVPISVRAKTGQTANLFQIQNPAGSNLFYVNSFGGLFASSSNITYASSTALTLSGDFFGNNILQSADSYINFGKNSRKKRSYQRRRKNS